MVNFHPSEQRYLTLVQFKDLYKPVKKKHQVSELMSKAISKPFKQKKIVIIDQKEDTHIIKVHR